MTALPEAVAGLDELRELGDAMTRIASGLLERGVGFGDAMEAFELHLLQAAMVRNGGNLSHTAAELCMHRNTLRSKLQRNGLRLRQP